MEQPRFKKRYQTRQGPPSHTHLVSPAHELRRAAE